MKSKSSRHTDRNKKIPRYESKEGNDELYNKADFLFLSIYYVPGIVLSVSHILPSLAFHLILLSSWYRQENKSQEVFILFKVLISHRNPEFLLFNTLLYCLPLDPLQIIRNGAWQIKHNNGCTKLGREVDLEPNI